MASSGSVREGRHDAHVLPDYRSRPYILNLAIHTAGLTGRLDQALTVAMRSFVLTTIRSADTEAPAGSILGVGVSTVPARCNQTSILLPQHFVANKVEFPVILKCQNRTLEKAL